MKSDDIYPKIVEECRIQNAAAAKNEKYSEKTCEETFALRAGKIREEGAGGTSDGAAFYEKAIDYGKNNVGRRTA